MEEKIEIAKMLGELKNPVRSKENPFYKSKYADLASILDLVRPVIKKFNLGITFTVLRKEDGEKWMRCSLVDMEGQIKMSSECPLAIPVSVVYDKDKNPIDTYVSPQDIGKAMTYAERYCLCALLGIAGENDDDDAQSISQPEKKEPKKVVKKESSKPTKKQMDYLTTLLIKKGLVIPPTAEMTAEEKDKLRAENKAKVIEYMTMKGLEIPKETEGRLEEILTNLQVSNLIDTIYHDLKEGDDGWVYDTKD